MTEPVDPAPPEAPDEHPVAQGRAEADVLDEEAYEWHRHPDLLTDDERALPYVVGVDVNAAFLAAASRLMVGLAAYSLQQRARADQKTKQAVSRQVAATANRLSDSDPALAAQLSLAAYRMAPTVEARSSLLASSWGPTVTRMVRPSGALQSVAATRDGRLLAAAGASKADTAIVLWDLANPAQPKVIGKPLEGHSGPVYAVAFSPNGKTLATGSADKTVRLWDVSDPARPRALGKPLTGPTDQVQAAEFSPDGSLLAVSAADKTVRVWDVSNPQHAVSASKPLTGASADLPSLTFRPDGRTLAVADEGGAVRLWDLADPRRPRPAGAPLPIPSRVNVVTFTPDGDTLAAGGNDGLLRLWNVADPARPTALGKPLKGGTGWIYTIAFSSDGRTAAVGDANNTVQLWDISTRQLIATLPHTEPVTVVAFRHNDRLLLTNSADGIARLWTVPGPALPGTGNNITTAALHPDGELLAAAGSDLQLWDITHRNRPVKVGPALAAPRGYDRMGGTVAISPDGHTLAAGTRQGNAVLLWDIKDPRHPRRLHTPSPATPSSSETSGSARTGR